MTSLDAAGNPVQPGDISVVVGNRCQSVGDTLLLYHGHHEHRTTVRQPVRRQVDVSNTAVIGMLNARSVGGKTTAIYDRIVADRLHLCALVETWHDAVDRSQLTQSCPWVGSTHGLGWVGWVMGPKWQKAIFYIH